MITENYNLESLVQQRPTVNNYKDKQLSNRDN